jgi:RNA polymerase sigma-70 factor, ECF subfamily
VTTWAAAGHAARPASPEDARFVASVRRGDERTFALLLNRYHAALVRVASIYVRDRAVAEEVAQETWLGVVEGIHRFQGRSSLKTWIFRILTNTAKTRGEREGRTIPFTTLVAGDGESEPSVEPERFRDASHPVGPGHWASPPASWDAIPERRLASKETLTQIRAAIDALPALQAEVISLRDVEGWSSEEVCQLLGLSEVNQRVLLHRARSKLRRALEDYFASE